MYCTLKLSLLLQFAGHLLQSHQRDAPLHHKHRAKSTKIFVNFNPLHRSFSVNLELPHRSSFPFREECLYNGGTQHHI